VDDPTAPSLTSSRSTYGWNVTATSISQNAGVVTQDELARGEIEHALSMAVFDAAKDTFLWPAQRSDGGSTEPDALPEGARLRLDPSLDIDTLEMSPLVRMLAGQRRGTASSSAIGLGGPTCSTSSNPRRESRISRAHCSAGLHLMWR
jgi:hypothetical protein